MAPTKWCMYTCNVTSLALLNEKTSLEQGSATAKGITQPGSQSKVTLTLTVHRPGLTDDQQTSAIHKEAHTSERGTGFPSPVTICAV